MPEKNKIHIKNYFNLVEHSPGLDAKGEPYGPRPVKIPKNSFGPVKKDLNWSYRATNIWRHSC